MRTCEQCGGKSSPYIPRKRVDGKLLCKGCASRALSSTASSETPDAARRKPGRETGDFGWEDDLAPEGYHPLAAPLPNSVWERYARRKELMGVPFIHPEHYRMVALADPDEDREPDLRLDGKVSRRVTATDGHDAPDSDPGMMEHPGSLSSEQMYSHLSCDHGISPSTLHVAIKGVLPATDMSHVVQMLHNQAHQEGPVAQHAHKGWTGGEKVAPGHTDVAVPFWGAPPDQAAKSYKHLMAPKEDGGHGIQSHGVQGVDAMVAEHLNAEPGKGMQALFNASEAESLEAQEKAHAALHAEQGEHAGHQHVPTTHEGVTQAEKLQAAIVQHLNDHHDETASLHPQMTHKELHDPEAYAYKGNPGHEHDSDGSLSISKGLPSKPSAFDHASAMSKASLLTHMVDHHWGHEGGKPKPGYIYYGALVAGTPNGELGSKSHDELLQQHALMHSSGEHDEHAHQGVTNKDPLDFGNYGVEPEIHMDTHPHVGSEAEAMTHLLEHHPNAHQGKYDEWTKGKSKGSITLKHFHEDLHTPGVKTTMGNTLPQALDGHDHAPEMGPPTTIAVGHHLVQDHGMAQGDVAAMTPAQFKSHHENLHAKPESEVGHGHDYPGGPVHEPRLYALNPHHAMFRKEEEHPAIQEWYHGTGATYEGPPKNATELQDDHGVWGNYGAGDWNNHVGTHWSSLHEMAKNFKSGRVIHARLHMRNPIVYNSLNHMSHDAYERLRASGHMQDNGEFHNNHTDDLGYNHCCSGRLLEYAKGEHRNDGKFGLEAFRDSLRASGHDGIVVRNQTDPPSGHWNAIPLSGDQIEILNGHCRSPHGDDRDHDVFEFNTKSAQTKQGWIHPKRYSPGDYTGRLGRLPDSDEVSRAHELKKRPSIPYPSSIGRGDSDRYLGGRIFHSAHEDDEDDEDQYCQHCDEFGDHTTDECQNKWCSVCEEHGDHTTEEEHEYCHHCDGYGDHDPEDCLNNPHTNKEAYCPHCDTISKKNIHSSTCVHCGEKLPEWGKLMAFGKPVDKDGYKEDGETPVASYGYAYTAPKQPSPGNSDELAKHLYHHHKSDTGGKEFDDKGNWDTAALAHHHQWLHQNSSEAKEQGFEVEHEHKQDYGKFVKQEDMSGDELKAHLLVGHLKNSVLPSQIISGLPEAKMQKIHESLHKADSNIPWGSFHDDFLPQGSSLKEKIAHTHDLEENKPPSDEEYYPKGSQIQTHLKMHHGVSALSGFLQENAGVADALHHQLHQNMGNAAEPGVGKFHIHNDVTQNQLDAYDAIYKHLVEDHGEHPDEYPIKNGDTAKLHEVHHDQHTNPLTLGDSGHTHAPISGYKMDLEKLPSEAEQIVQHLKEHHGDESAYVQNFKDNPDKLMDLHSGKHAVNALPKSEHDHHNLVPDHDSDSWTSHTNESMKPKVKEVPLLELKNSSVNDLLKDGYDMEPHLSYHHPDSYSGLKHVTGFDYAPGTPFFTKALTEAHEAHMKAHSEGADHDHGGTALPGHYHGDGESDGKKESRLALRTLSELFEEVAR